MAKHSYVFKQFLDLIPRYEFQRFVEKYNGDHRTRTFKCWHHMVCLIFAHIRNERSLRDIDIALNSHASKLYHIGIQQAPKSTLADANERRDCRIYEEFAKSMMNRVRRVYSSTDLALDIENGMFALDASTIDLTLSVYPWAKFRKTKGAIKLHAMIDLRGNIPAFMHITDGKVHDIKATPHIPIEAGGIYVVDRAYVDFKWLWSINQEKAFYVTRLKRSINWNRVVSHPVEKSLGLRCDQEILLSNPKSTKLYPERIRRVSFRDKNRGKSLVFLTNNFDLPAISIATIYKQRWEIELFFKWIKQNLRVKTFYGYSPNAVKTQIWVAMIVYLLVAVVKHRYHIDYPMSKLLHFLEVNLFEKKDIQFVFIPNARNKVNNLNCNHMQLKLFDY